MGNTIVNTDILSSKALEDYITSADHRIRVGFRVALEALQLPLPEFAARRPTGPKPGKRIAAAFAADAAIHGDYTYTEAGNRRIGNTLPPSRFAANPAPAATPKPVSIDSTERLEAELAPLDPTTLLGGKYAKRG